LLFSPEITGEAYPGDEEDSLHFAAACGSIAGFPGMAYNGFGCPKEGKIRFEEG
jgi:hypothetical protein